MTIIPAIEAAARLEIRPETPTEPAETPRRHLGLRTLPSTLAAWDERRRFRRKLEQLAKESPHLIDDIGLTRRQVEAEIAKPFWRA